MNHKYIVQLTDEEREELRALVQKGQTQGYRIKHAQILMKLDEIPENQEWTYDKIKEAYHATPHTISQIAKRFVTGGHSGCISASLRSSQCLSQSLSSFELMARQVNTWTLHRNAACSTVHWRFSVSDA